MYVKSYCSRNWRFDPPWLQKTVSSSTFVPQEDCKQSRWYLRHCAPGWDSCLSPTAQDTDKDHCPPHRLKNAAAFYLINFPPEFQTPYLHFSSPYKKGWLKMECKTVSVQTHCLLRSQIKRPWRFNPVSAYWVWQVTGSTNAGFSSFIPTNVKEPCVSLFCFFIQSQKFPRFAFSYPLNLPPMDFM